MFRSLSRAAAKYAKSRLRGTGLLSTSTEWMARTAVCAQCPLYTLHKKVPYCGRPLIESPVRGAEEGCGCPLAAKTRAPEEHCPVTAEYREAAADGPVGCDCKWCVAKRPGGR